MQQRDDGERRDFVGKREERRRERGTRLPAEHEEQQPHDDEQSDCRDRPQLIVGLGDFADFVSFDERELGGGIDRVEVLVAAISDARFFRRRLWELEVDSLRCTAQ